MGKDPEKDLAGRMGWRLIQDSRFEMSGTFMIGISSDFYEY